MQAWIADPDSLRQILLDRVIDEQLSVLRLLRKGSIQTLQGQTVYAEYRDRNGTINDAIVVNPGVQAPNGIVHVIGSVLLPAQEENEPDLVDLLAADGRFETLLAAVEAAGLEDLLRSLLIPPAE